MEEEKRLLKIDGYIFSDDKTADQMESLFFQWLQQLEGDNYYVGIIDKKNDDKIRNF